MLPASMFYIALLPAPVLFVAALALLILLTLAYRKRPGRSTVKTDRALWVISAVQLLATALPLYLTAQSPISRAACLTGLGGIQVQLAVFGGVALLAVIGYARAGDGVYARLRQNALFLCLVFLANFGTMVIFVRSVLRCTV